jgi:hypothetical protein
MKKKKKKKKRESLYMCLFLLGIVMKHKIMNFYLSNAAYVQ